MKRYITGLGPMSVPGCTGKGVRVRFSSVGTGLVACMLLAACSGGHSGRDVAAADTVPMLVMQIRECSKLYTAEYRVHKIVTHDDRAALTGTLLGKDFSVDLPLGRRRTAIPMDVTLKAYVDFSRFDNSQVVRRGSGKIEIILSDPKVTLVSSRIDHAGVKQYVPFTRSDFTDEELASYERQGREAVIRSIPRIGIVPMARENAARILIPMLVRAGYNEDDITVSFRKGFSPEDIIVESGDKR